VFESPKLHALFLLIRLIPFPLSGDER